MKRIRVLRALDWGIFAALCLALPLIVPFLQAGLPLEVDAENHLHRIVSVLVNWQNGYLWPRWTPYMYLQYGYPLHDFHPAGTYLVQALIYTVTHADILTVFKASIIGITFLYPIGAYLFARTFTGRAGALVAAAAYIYAPFRFRELWVQMDVPQFAAMLMLPWLLWAMARGAEQRRIGWGVLIAGCLGALILFHHSTTFLAVPLIIGYAVLLIFDRWRAEGFRMVARTSITVVGGLALGALLATIYWLPALTELQYLQIRQIKNASYEVANNFIPLAQLVSRTIPIDRSWLNWSTYDSSDGARMGFAQFLAVGAGLLAWIPRFHTSFKVRWHVLAGLLGVAVCLFLITPNSAMLWKIIPFASQIQYPWRLLGDISVLVIPGAAIIPALFVDSWRPWVAAALIFAFFWSTMPLLYAPLSFISIPSPTPATEIAHEISSGNLGTTTVDEYLPKWAQTRPMAGLATADLRNQAANALQVFGWNVWPDDSNLPTGASIIPLTSAASGTNAYRIQTPTAFTLYFHQMYFPGWDVRIDAQPATLTPSQPEGLITTPLASGTHVVSIRYGGTPVQHVADAISIGSVLIVCGLLFLELIQILQHRARPRQTNQAPDPLHAAPHAGSNDPRERRLAHSVILTSLVFVVINQAFLIPHTDLFRPQSAPGVTPASVHIHIPFGDSIALLGYDLSRNTLLPGGLLHIRLYWQATKKTDVPLQASVALTSPDDQQVWAQTTSYGLAPDVGDAPIGTTYLTDDYDMRVASDTPAFNIALRVSVFVQESSPIQFLKTPSGLTDAVLTTLPVSGDYRTVADRQIVPVNVTFNNRDVLVGYHFSAGPSARQTCLTLRWNVRSATLDATPVQVMIHFLGSKDSILGTADSPPLNGQYPVSAWRPGQTLDDTHCFGTPAGLKEIAVGLYTLPKVQRLPVTSTYGISVPDASVAIPFS